ncbi:LUD domain-containing protein [uncultured Peptoniphilus sp.]|uniref:LUD domain-containing protein n=1 Tax=uncultured Peptoniphilus sp. TaxID=254354 RepID=UPI002805F494|nr:LUD domain-containing protein [uncultured Peptoniphilus sp.]
MIDLIRTKTSLEKNGFFTYLFENRDEAVDYFLHFAGSGKSFGFAGSKTVKELGQCNILKERGNPCY